MIRTLLLIAIGGGFGSMLRYLTSLAIEKYYATIFPLATFIVNVLGCLLIGIIMGLHEKNQATNASMKWLLVTGFCGGYTTFSTFGFENITLLQNQHTGLAFLYIAGSILSGLIAVWVGLWFIK
jgi:CrcB protein